VSYAERDLASARVLVEAGELANALFHCQQAIEKTLKAVILERTGEEPPRIHNLMRLAQLAPAELSEDQMMLMRELGVSYIESRYPDASLAEQSQPTAESARSYLARTEELIQWLLSRTS